MTIAHPYVRLGQTIVALVAAAFGVATMVAGGRVLAGADPGYVVFRPLLVFNTAMGVAYLAAAAITWRSIERGKFVAAAITLLNLLVLAVIGFLYATGHAVAIDSLRAMTFRTVVWFALSIGLVWMGRATHPSRT